MAGSQIERSSSFALNRAQRLAQWSMANRRLRASRATTSCPRSACCKLGQQDDPALAFSASRSACRTWKTVSARTTRALPKSNSTSSGPGPGGGDVQADGEGVLVPLPLVLDERPQLLRAEGADAHCGPSSSVHWIGEPVAGVLLQLLEQFLGGRRPVLRGQAGLPSCADLLPDPGRRLRGSAGGRWVGRRLGRRQQLDRPALGLGQLGGQATRQGVLVGLQPGDAHP